MPSGIICTTKIGGDKFEIENYETKLNEIDQRIKITNKDHIPLLFDGIPLEVFGELTLQEQTKFRNIKEFLPEMVSDETQLNWTGSYGHHLMKQSVSVIESIIEFYKFKRSIVNFNEKTVLDFGCGWGRLIRLLYKYFGETNIYAADAWEESLKKCKESGVRANFIKIDDICKNIPIEKKIDLVISFSVFTHLSEKASKFALNAIRNSINEQGILALTIRNYDYWKVHSQYWDKSFSISEATQRHIKEGFSFIPHKNRTPIDGEITFGDTTISLKYINENWKDWKLLDYKINSIDPHQTILFLEPC